MLVSAIFYFLVYGRHLEIKVHNTEGHVLKKSVSFHFHVDLSRFHIGYTNFPL